MPLVCDRERVVGNPLEQLGLTDLRRRTNIEWRTQADDVLPLWVAEMDVAEPVQEALVAAVLDGDTGYPTGPGYAQAVARFAVDRWGWDGVDVERTALVPDVMQGIVEALRPETAPGDAVVVNCPVYPPFYGFAEAMGRCAAAAFPERGRVAVSAGPSFGTGGAGHVRLIFSTSQDLLEQAVRRMGGPVVAGPA